MAECHIKDSGRYWFICVNKVILDTVNGKKKILGIIGGMGARAGVLFMQKVVDYSPVTRDQEFIEMILHSNACIPDRTAAILYDGEPAERELIRSVSKFREYNVEAIVLACITACYYYDTLERHTSAHILHPVEILLEYLRTRCSGIQRIGLLASTGAVRTGIFHRLLEPAKLDVITLNETEQEQHFMRSLYMPEGLKSGTISDRAKELFFESVNDIRRRQVDVIVGGCSEVSILLDQNMLDIPYIDIMDLLARETVSYCYGREK